MLQITTGSVQVGDVLYHPAMGFARVAQREGETLLLAWGEDGREGLPRRVTEHSAAKTWRRCRSDGFFARSVKDPRRLRRLLYQDGRVALKLLLEDLGEAQHPRDLAQWLAGRSLLEEAEFEHWWQRLNPPDDPLFVFRAGRLWLSSQDEETSPIEPELPWAQRHALSGLAWVHAGLELCALLAREHAEGHGAGLSRNTLVLEQGNLQIVPGEHSVRTADVYQAGLLLLERSMGRPLPSLLAPAKLMPWINGLSAGLPPTAVPLLERMLCTTDERPRTAIELFSEWSAAAAIEEIRQGADTGRENFVVGADTHIGRQKMASQQANQDFMAVETEKDEMLVVVCDGISTSTAGTGDLASRIATDVLTDAWHRRSRNLGRDLTASRDFIEEALAEANAQVCEAALQEAGGNLAECIPMGTTVVLALVHGELIDLAWLGDSRAYHVGLTGAGCLTADHNVLLDWLDGSRVQDDHNAHMGRTLTRYLGHFADDTPTLLSVQHRRVRMIPGEWLLLCTDGVSDFAAPTHKAFTDRIAEILRSSRGPKQAAQALVCAANEGGGGDNATAVVLRLSSG